MLTRRSPSRKVESHVHTATPTVAADLSEIDTYPVQIIGIGIMTLLIVAALLGIFGATTNNVQASTRELTLALEYGSRMRYGQPQTLNIAVTNHSDPPIEGAFVQIGRYLTHFSDIQIIPFKVRITDDSYDVLLDPMAAGETRFVMIEMRTERGGMYAVVVMIHDGQFLEDAMNRERITTTEISSEMQKAGLETLAQIKWAILEPDGKIAFITHEQEKLTRKTHEERVIG